MSIQLYDTTLRDGAQKEGISFSVVDKLNIAGKLDELGIHYIEGGWPGSNPKDIEFFNKAHELNLKNAKLVAFGSTRRANGKAEDDATLASLVEAKTDIVTLVSKCSARQVTQVLETTLEENINMITDSTEYLKGKGISVFIDAEHFFDGFKDNQQYALDVLIASEKAGADCLVLCDTNGGTLPDEAFDAVKKVCEVTSIPIGIHAHNDSELAVAVTLAAVKAGATHVQGTINGFGERCGNANLCSIIPNLKLKMDIDCISDNNLTKLSEVASYINETANLKPNPSLPYVGSSAFSHKAGLHVSGLSKWSGSYQHIDPALVGNKSRMLISELSGRSNIVHRASQIGVSLPPKGKEAQQLLEKVKDLESRGFQYENAEASFDLLVHRAQSDYQSPFELVDFMVIIESRRRSPTTHNSDEALSEAMVKVRVDGQIMHTASEGNGPVNAMDKALRKALIQSYPQLSCIQLVDYKVRILDSKNTASQVRVLIESTDGADHWNTVGSSANIIEASWLALADSLEYWLIKNK
ncbi:MAG: citramalate synthase [Dehalococcoidales bacterium]|jgi:2-isopropylmalate synthase|nr:citramalate synthase [Dehalococcoidales bacterium]